MSSTNWNNTSGGNWTDGANWDNGVPTEADDATLGLTGGYSVVLSGGEAAAANSLTISDTNASLQLNTNGGSSTTLAVQAGLTNGGTVDLDRFFGEGGSDLTIGGTLANAGAVFIGNTGLSAATQLTATGLVNTGSIFVQGNPTSGTRTQATLDIAGTVSSALSGRLSVAGDADVALGSAVTSIGSGGELDLLGSQARVSLGVGAGNTALADLAINVGILDLEGGTGSGAGGASLTTTVDFANSGTVELDRFFGEGGSSLTLGGTLTNANSVFIGNTGLSAAVQVTAAGLVNTGSIFIQGNPTSGTATQATLDITGTVSSALSGRLSVAGDADVALGSAITSIGSAGELDLLGSQARVSLGVGAGNTALTGLGSNAGILDLEGGTGSGAGGASLTTTADFANSGGTVELDRFFGEGGSSLTLGGTLANAGIVFIGNTGLSAATQLTAAGLTNTGSIFVHGNPTSGTATQATLNITGTVSSVMSGQLSVAGDADVALGSAITSIASGGLDLLGSQARVSLGIGAGNTALTGLATNLGVLDLEGGTGSGAGGAALTTTVDFTNGGGVELDRLFGEGGSSLILGGTLNNTNTIFIGNTGLSAATQVTATGLVGTGSIFIQGNSTSGTATQATLDITGTVSSVMSGELSVFGDADVALGSAITSIASGGQIDLAGSLARVSLGVAVGNTALTGLATNAGILDLEGSTGFGAGGAALTTTVDFANSGTVELDHLFSGGGSSLSLGGTLTNTNALLIGNTGLSAATQVTAAGLVNISSIFVQGNPTSGTATQATLDITGAVSSTLSGRLSVAGDADVALGSAITSIASGGELDLLGSQARISLGVGAGNTALTGLATNLGVLDLEGGTGSGAGGAALTTTVDFANSGTVELDRFFGEGGSSLVLGGTLTNTNTVFIGNTGLSAAATQVTAAGLVNTGSIFVQGNTAATQATLDITGAAVNTGNIVLGGAALLNASSLTVQNGGRLTVSAGGTADGVIVGGGGLATVIGGGAIDAPVISGGGLELAGGATVTGNITIGGFASVLQLDSNNPLPNTIAGMAPGNQIDLRGLTWNPANTVDFTGGVLTVSGGGVTDQLTLTGVASRTVFVTSDDGSGGTLVEAAPLPSNIFSGTYANGLVLSDPAVQQPAVLTSSALVMIGGSSYNRAVYGENVIGWTVINFGTVLGQGVDSTGIGLAAGGSVVNGAPGMPGSPVTSALVTGTQNGVAIEGASGSVVNFGTIASTSQDTGVGVHLARGGRLVNGAPGSPGALVSASRVAAYLGGNNGVAYAGAAGTVINYGTMTGSLYDVVALVGGGTVANYGSIVGQGTASGGVYLSPGGFVLNEGVIIGPERGVYITGGLGTVINEGSIAATNDNAAAVGLAAGGSVLNDALITAYRVGVFGGTAGSPTSVINLGTIAVTATGTQGGPASFGVLLLESGVVGNIGVISAVQPGTGPNTGGVGVALVAGGVVTNGVVTNGVSGGVPGVIGPAVIRGASYGVLVNGGAAFVSNYGTIAGATGVSVAMAAGGSTIVNAGTISGSGGIAVKFGPGEDVLVEAAGSVLQGAIGNLQAGDVIDLRFLPFVAGGSAALGANNLLSVVAGGATAGVQLDPAQNFAGVAFALSDDGQGGTDVKETVFGIVGPGQTLVVSAGVTLTGVTVLSGGTLDVLSGGAVITTSVAGGGTEIVEFGGLDVSATLAGLEEVFGLASGTVLLGGASQVVEAGGVTQAVVLDAAAVQTVSGVASGTVVSAGDRQIVASGGVASGTVVSSGGQEIVQAGGTMLVPVISGGGISGGGLVDLQAGGVAGGAITFSGRGGELELDSNAMPAGPLVGFDRGDLIDLRGVSPAGGTVSFDPASGFLTVSGGGVVDTLVLQGGVTPGTVFRLGDDGQGGSLVEAGPPAPGGLGLQASSDSGALGDGITNVAAPLLLGSGEANDTVTVFDGTVPVGSATVEVNGSWASQLSTLAEGQHTLTARETDPAANVSGPSAGFSLRLDLTPPVAAVTAPLTVLWSSGAVPFGIGAPSDANDLTSSLSVLVTGVPGNGAVTLADGVTPVTPFESLSVAQLTGLEFIPGGSGKIGTTGTFGYTVFDPAGNTGAGSAAASVVAAGAASLFSFVFSYADGRDYYTGTVADNGAFGYQVGQTRATASGQYMIVNAQTLTTAPVGTVSVLNYTHGGAGQASGVPLMTAAGQPDGTAGLGSEADAVLGTDGQAHPFSATSEAMFGTIALYGFVYTYANGAAFYSGTVADDGTLTAGTKTVSDSSGRVLGTYTVFADGVTTRAGGSVVVDRYNVGDTSFLPIHATAASVDGSQGLGSELGSIPVNGTAVPFGAAQEPGLQANIVPVPVVPPPPQADIFTAEITEIYSEVLGRGPQGGELATGTSQLSQGVDLAVIRQGLAQSGEAQGDLNQLYQQILDRPGDTAGQANYTAQLIDGASLATVQLLIAQSPEAQADINQIYLDVLGTGVDGFGLTSSMGALANGSDINAVRSAVAHSPAADDSLSQLFLGTIGRIPDAAELAGMEDQLGAAGSGVSRTGLQSTLAASGSAGGFTMVTAGPGSAILTAPPNTPTEFVFGNIGFGADTITGFDPSRDALVISSALVPDLATLQSETRQTALGTLITLSPSQSITLPGINLDTLNPNDFRIV